MLYGDIAFSFLLWKAALQYTDVMCELTRLPQLLYNLALLSLCIQVPTDYFLRTTLC